VWGTHEDENQLEGNQEEEGGNEKRDRVFDSSNLHGVPQPPIANSNALERRAVPKNPKIIVNPKHRATSTITSRALTATNSPQTGSVALTSYSDNSSEFFILSCLSMSGEQEKEKMRTKERTTKTDGFSILVTVWAGSLTIGSSSQAFKINFDTG
jgi:hypothetical protein